MTRVIKIHDTKPVYSAMIQLLNHKKMFFYVLRKRSLEKIYPC
jgi:hypothetical protein